MSLLRRLPSRDVRRVADVSLEEMGLLLGQDRGVVKSKAGVTVGARRALGITAWYSGVRYISEVTASLPVHTYRDRNGERSRRSDPPWMRSPDVDQTWFGLVEFWLMSMLHKGNAYAFKLRKIGRAHV